MKVGQTKSIFAKRNKICKNDKNCKKINAEKTGLEKSVDEELSEVKQRFADDAKIEKLRFKQNTDSEYWVAICFQSREHKEDFLKQADLMEIGDKYLDGILVAEKLGLKLDPQNIPPMPKFKRIDKKYKSLVKED